MLSRQNQRIYGNTGAGRADIGGLKSDLFRVGNFQQEKNGLRQSDHQVLRRMGQTMAVPLDQEHRQKGQCDEYNPVAGSAIGFFIKVCGLIEFYPPYWPQNGLDYCYYREKYVAAPTPDARSPNCGKPLWRNL